jgi:hypothetical protein
MKVDQSRFIATEAHDGGMQSSEIDNEGDDGERQAGNA